MCTVMYVWYVSEKDYIDYIEDVHFLYIDKVLLNFNCMKNGWHVYEWTLSVWNLDNLSDQWD